LPIGARLQAGEAVLEVVQIGKPPHLAHTYSFQSPPLLSTDGICCRVAKGCRMRRGNEIVVLKVQRTSKSALHLGKADSGEGF